MEGDQIAQRILEMEKIALVEETQMLGESKRCQPDSDRWRVVLKARASV